MNKIGTRISLVVIPMLLGLSDVSYGKGQAGCQDNADCPTGFRCEVGLGCVAEVEPAVTLAAAGWSYGECMGACVGHLALDGTNVRYRIHGYSEEWAPGFIANQGTLTLQGERYLAGLEAFLAQLALREVYGCPDCADGGARFIEIDRAGTVTRHYYEANSEPPLMLSAAHHYVEAIMDALKSCEENVWVVPSPDCEPGQ